MTLYKDDAVMLKIKTMRHKLILLSILALTISLIFAGCEGGDDPMRLGTQITPGGTMMAGIPVDDPMGGDVEGGTPAGMIMGGEPAGDTPGGVEVGGEPIGGNVVECNEVGPDETVFADVVGPSLITTCAATGCHGPSSRNGLILPVSSAEFTPPLSGDLLASSLEASMAYVTPGEPSQSVLLSKAYDAHIFLNQIFFDTTSPEYTQLSDWITDMIFCEEVSPPLPGGEPMGGEPMGGEPMDIDPGGGENDTSIFCDLLPNGDPQNRADGLYYEQFAEEINTSLSNSCAGRNGCHNTPTPGFWIQPSSEICAIPANFLMIQAYINFVDVDNSPILTAPYDPNHSGYQIYIGRSDPEFVALRNWVLLAFE
jgi:hypothetical protein